MKERLPRVLLYSLLLLVVFSLLQQWTHMNVKLITPHNGVADLTEQDLSRELVDIAPEEWAYYPGRLYTPEELSGAQTVAPIYGDNAAQAQVGTYQLVLKLIPGRIYAVTGHSFPFSQRVYIDGKLIDEIGRPGADREHTTPSSRTYLYYFSAEGESTEIVFQVANFYHREGGRNNKMKLAEPSVIDRYQALELIQTCVVMGCLITVFLYLLGVYIFFVRRYHFLFLALVGLVTAVRMLFIGEKHIMELFPGLGWVAAMRIEYLCLILLVAFLQLYFAALYPKMLDRRYLAAIVGLSALYALIVLFTDSLVFTQLLKYYTVVWVVASIVTLWKLAWQLRYGDVHTALIFFGLMVFAVTAVYDEVAYLFVLHIRLYNTLVTGVLVCLFLNLITLMLSFSDMETTLTHTERQRQELDETNQLLDRLNEMKSDYLADMSHEMRTPLTVISANSQLSKALMEVEADKQEIEQYLDAITEESARLARMASGILELSSYNETQSGMEALDIGTLLRNSADAYTAMVEKKGNLLEVVIPDRLPLVRGNSDMLLQVVTNLLSNANRHTDKGRLTLSAEAKNGWVQVAVRDTGEGIAPDMLLTVFERHVQSRRGEGKGLGLWICRTIVKRHGGSIEIKSAQGDGTTVWFTLPVVKGESV